jgi:hypothetical protein
LAYSIEGDAQRLEGRSTHTVALVDQAQQNVLGPYERVVQQARFFLCQG